MPAADDLTAFAVTAFIIIVIPGPSVLFIVARALAHGARVSVLTVIGNTAGQYVQVVAVAFGVGLLAERSVAIFTVLKLFGAAYLVFLGVQTFRHRRSLAAALTPEPEPQPARRYFFQGFIVSSTRCIKMTSPIKIFPGKSIYIKTFLTSERAFTFISPVDDNSSQPDSFYAERKINEPFCVAGPYIEFNKI